MTITKGKKLNATQKFKLTTSAKTRQDKEFTLGHKQKDFQTRQDNMSSHAGENRNRYW